MPPIRITSVTFERELNGVNQAMPLLEGPGQAPSAVDWERIDGGVRTSAVAYARTVAAPVTLEVTFDIVNPTRDDIRVRAIQAAPSPFGDVAPERVTTDRGRNRPRRFRISAPRLSSESTGRKLVEWNWEWSENDGAWQPLGRTSHEVYVLLERPVRPWLGNRLWKEVVDRACTWADGSTNFNRCTAAIVDSVYNLGGQLIPITDGSVAIGYDQAPKFHRGETLYDLDAFLDTAATRRGAEDKLSCWDCAGAVALLAGALGCDLRLMRISAARGDLTFRTNPIKLIGRSRSSPKSFDHHYVNATVNDEGENPRIWDACLKLDVDARLDETAFGLAKGMTRFPSRSRAGYEKQLVASDEPAVRMRLGSGTGIVSPTSDGQPIEIVNEPADFRLDFARDMSDSVAIVPRIAPNPSDVRDELLRETSPRASQFNSRNRRNDLAIARIRSHTHRGCDLHAWLVTAPDAPSARDAFVEMAVHMSAPKKPLKGIGDAALVCQDDGTSAILIRRGNTVLRLVNDHGHLIDIAAEGKALDDALSAIYARP